MPYHIGSSDSCPKSKPYAVLNDATGKAMGCHPTKEDANKQLGALYANEPGLKSVDETTMVVRNPKKPLTHDRLKVAENRATRNAHFHVACSHWCREASCAEADGRACRECRVKEVPAPVVYG